MAVEESISLEETNKIRISLGLKPLVEDDAPADNADQRAEDNYQKRRDQEAKDKQSKAISDRIAKVRNKQELNAKLKGATLGQDIGGSLGTGEAEDTRKWLKKSKKREKELARKRAEELENMDKAAQDAYTEDDLVGLKVSHDFEDMNEGDARILTLKDSRILDNEEDELHNVEMAEEAQTQKINDLKIKKRTYTGYDDDEFVAGSEGMKRAVLAKYDEDINGPKETGFRLGSSSKANQKPASVMQEVTAVVNKSLLSIDYAKTMITQDYLQEGDIGFKKPKTKKKRPSRRQQVEAEVEADDVTMEPIDSKTESARIRDLDANFVDDDELQAALTRARKNTLHKRKKLSPEEIARKVAQERVKEEAQAADEVIKIEEADAAAQDGVDASRGIIIDDTSEFVRAIQYNPAAPKVKVEAVDTHSSKSRGDDVKMEEADEKMDEMDVDNVVVKDEEDEDEGAMLNAIEAAIKATEASERGDAADDIGGTSTEQTFNSGMASTLNILRQSGILAPPTASQTDRERTQLQRDMWLADQRAKVAQRELERLQSRGGNRDQATREYENRVREQREARESLEAFKDYKPDVNIVYYDEHGRTLTPKEAWKALSHKFHGKGSGRAKVEKRLKKIAEEKKAEAMISGDTPLSMNSAFQKRQELTGQAHFVLSVGNRGAVPQAADYFDAQPLAKTKQEKKQKKKDAAAAKVAAETGFMTLPAPQSQFAGVTMSPNILGAVARQSGSPAPKVGFTKITAASEAKTQEANLQGGTPVPADRSKVTFGFGTKRKADEDGADTPPTKRR